MTVRVGGDGGRVVGMRTLTTLLVAMMLAQVGVWAIGGLAYLLTDAPWLGAMLLVNGYAFAGCAALAIVTDLLARKRRS
jgi:hypothetical protein